MEGLISQLEGEDLLALCGIFLGLVAILGGISIGLVAVIAHHFRRSRMDDIEATLKMEMLERGLSATEIQQVLKARGSDSCAPQEMASNGFAGWRQMRREIAKPGRA